MFCDGYFCFSLPGLIPILAVLSFPAAIASAASDPLPPPGFYHLKNTYKSDMPTGPDTTTLRHSTDARDGSSFDQWERGGKSVSSVLPGSGPVTVCVRKQDQKALPSRMFAQRGCSGPPGVMTDSGLTSTLSCPFADMTVNVQKIDAMTWEFRVRTIMKSVAPKPDDFASNVEFMGAIIKQGAANAKTPQERAQAAEMLQKLDGARRQAAEAAVAGRAIQPQMDQALAHSPLVGRVGADISSVYWMTRVADRCP